MWQQISAFLCMFLFLAEPMGWNHWEKTGKFYKMFKKQVTWMEAQSNCTSLGVMKESQLTIHWLIDLLIISGKSCNDPWSENKWFCLYIIWWGQYLAWIKKNWTKDQRRFVFLFLINLQSTGCPRNVPLEIGVLLEKEHFFNTL